MKQINFTIQELASSSSGKKFDLKPGNCIMISNYGGNWCLSVLPSRNSRPEDAFGFMFDGGFVPNLGVNEYIGFSRNKKFFDSLSSFVSSVIRPFIISDHDFLRDKREYYFILS